MSADRTTRRELPEGTVTLLFADVEGSTRLLMILGDGFASARARMRELVRKAAADHDGAEVDWAGDGVFLAFARARDAISAAAEIQRSLAAEPWPSNEAHRLRIGVHTGEPELRDDGYVGMDVVLAARICASGHGEQVVVSRATYDLVEDVPSFSFRPLGSHRLKDVPRAEQLFQLVIPGLPDSFRPLRTLGGATLPALHHRLVGRRADLTATLSLLARPDVRLVTITGPGGAGKSRLALEAAALAAVERPIHLVGLAPVADPANVLPAIARALEVRESSERPLAKDVAEALSGTRAVLVLDNFEHLAPAAHHVAALLDLAPDLDVLVTSRAPLRLTGEHVVRLEPLPVNDAATLFAELAAARGVVLREDATAAVREICRRLDGLPLAIELVAARLAVLPPAHLLQALDEGIGLDFEGPVDLPERQRTLRATIEWSYGLLGESQRRLHQVLAVFAGGCTLEDGRALAGAESEFFADLEALASGSLIRTDISEGDVRISMLETVREAAIALAPGDRLDDLRRRHAEHFVDLATTAEEWLTGPEQGRWLDRLEPELDNIRAGLAWLLAAGRIEDALRATSALGRFWRMRAHVSEGRRWLTLALDRAQDGDVAPDVIANALWWSARQAAAQDDVKAEVPLLERALVLFRELGLPREAAFALGELGWIALQQGDTARAEELCEEALHVARDTGDPTAISGQLNYLADVYSERGEHARALAAHEEALELRRGLEDPMLVANSTYNLGIAAFENGEPERARRAFEDTRQLAVDIGDLLHIAAAEFMLAELDLFGGDPDGAEEKMLRSLAAFTELGSERSRAECLVVLAGVACERGSFEQAARLLGAAEQARGDSPLNRFELPVLERYAPTLEEALDAPRRTELTAEGARLGYEAAAGLAVVSTGKQE